MRENQRGKNVKGVNVRGKKVKKKVKIEGKKGMGEKMGEVEGKHRDMGGKKG